MGRISRCATLNNGVIINTIQGGASMKTIYLAQPKHSSWNHFFKPALGGLCLASALALLGPLPADAAAAKSISVEQTIPVKTEWSENWQPEVRDTLQELCSQYGKNAANYKENRHP